MANLFTHLLWLGAALARSTKTRGSYDINHASGLAAQEHASEKENYGSMLLAPKKQSDSSESTSSSTSSSDESDSKNGGQGGNKGGSNQNGSKDGNKKKNDNKDKKKNQNNGDDKKNQNNGKDKTLCVKCHPLGTVIPHDDCGLKAYKAEKCKECKTKKMETQSNGACCAAQSTKCPYDCNSMPVAGSKAPNSDIQVIASNPVYYPDVQSAK